MNESESSQALESLSNGCDNRKRKFYSAFPSENSIYQINQTHELNNEKVLIEDQDLTISLTETELCLPDKGIESYNSGQNQQFNSNNERKIEVDANHVNKLKENIIESFEADILLTCNLSSITTKLIDLVGFEKETEKLSNNQEQETSSENNNQLMLTEANLLKFKAMQPQIKVENPTFITNMNREQDSFAVVSKSNNHHKPNSTSANSPWSYFQTQQILMNEKSIWSIADVSSNPWQTNAWNYQDTSHINKAFSNADKASELEENTNSANETANLASA